jgi:hypothetical protein
MHLDLTPLVLTSHRAREIVRQISFELMRYGGSELLSDSRQSRVKEERIQVSSVLHYRLRVRFKDYHYPVELFYMLEKDLPAQDSRGVLLDEFYS